MYILSLASFLLLGGFLLLTALRYGVPNMVSDTFYQLQGTTGSEIVPFNNTRNMGWLFTVVMMLTAFVMLVCILDTGKGIQFLAFLGCSGLAFVGCSPNYFEKEEGTVHRTAATVAAVGCVGWCLSVSPLPTVIISTVYVIYLTLTNLFKALNGIWYISKNTEFHPWYWAEVAAFTDVYVCYWLAC